MKILQLIHSFLPQIGGAQIAVHNLSEGLSKCGHETMISTTTTTSITYKHSYSLQRVPLPPFLIRLGLLETWISWILFRTSKKWHPDIIHAHLIYPAGIAAVKIKEKLNIPIVITSHGGDLIVKPKIGYGLRLNSKTDQKTRYAISKADYLISLNRNISELYVQLGGNPNNISYIPNGINYDILASKKCQDPRVRFTPDEKIVLLAGRNHPVKGYKEFLSAVPYALEKESNLTFVFVGLDMSSLRIEAGKYNFPGDRVRFFDPVDPVDINLNDSKNGKLSMLNFYHSADIYMMCSHSEALPVSMIEAMASGLPIIASKAAGENLVEIGVNGYLADDGDNKLLIDRLALLANNPGLMGQFGNASKVKAKAYDRQYVAQEHIKVYKKLMKI